MCSEAFKRKVEELTTRFKADAKDQALFQLIENIVLGDPELAKLITTEERTMKKLNLKLEPQKIRYDLLQGYLPEKWEMPRDGKLLYTDEELQRALLLILFNLGVKKSLEVIPDELIQEYLQQKTNSYSL